MLETGRGFCTQTFLDYTSPWEFNNNKQQSFPSKETEFFKMPKQTLAGATKHSPIRTSGTGTGEGPLPFQTVEVATQFCSVWWYGAGASVSFSYTGIDMALETSARCFWSRDKWI